MSASEADEALYAAPSVPSEASENQGTNVPSLSDLSEKDKPWDKHRSHADTVQTHYRTDAEFENYSRRVSVCSQFLEFHLREDSKGSVGERRLKLTGARFCRVRHCPVCQWRRSLMWKAKAYKVLPEIVKAYPKHRWLFVTLTVKNCPITELRSTLQWMNQAFKRMTMRKLWPADGWLRSTEVTRGRDGSAHPHFHCLLMVKPSYFSHNYIRQGEWVKLWRSCLRIDYNPVMDVQAVKRGTAPMQLVPELLKYCTKESDLVADREWFLQLTRQMHKLRCISTGGVLKDYLRALEEEPEDLIGKDDEDTTIEDDDLKLYFQWRRKEKKYKLKD